MTTESILLDKSTVNENDRIYSRQGCRGYRDSRESHGLWDNYRNCGESPSTCSGDSIEIFGWT